MNPFDELDGEDLEGPLLKSAPRPSAWERFRMNVEAGWRHGTLFGVLQPERERSEFDRRYDVLPQWETPMEGATALIGQIVGGGGSIENFLPVGLGVRAAQTLKLAPAATSTQVFAGAVDAAAVNAAIDPIIQGVDIFQERKEGFSPEQLLLSIVGGGLAGGTLNGAVHTLRRQRQAIAETDPDLSLEFELPPLRPPMEPARRQPPTDTEGTATGKLVEPLTAEPVIEFDRSFGDIMAERAREAREIAEQQERAELAHERMAGVRETMLRDMSRGAPKKPKPALSLLQFLAGNGGIREEGGELAGRDLGAVFIPRFGPLVRKNGITLDYAREAAAEAGYFRGFRSNEEAIANSTPDDLLRLIDEERGGNKVFSVADDAIVQERAARAAYEQAREDLKTATVEIGHALADDLDDVVKRRAVEIRLEEGIDPGDAIERAIFEDYGAAEAPKSKQDDDGMEVPFDDEAGPEPQRGGVQERGGAAAQAGAADERPRQAAEVEPGRDQSGVAGGLQGRARSESTAVGEQLVIPGAEREGLKQTLDRRAASSLKPKKPQELVMDEGLFEDPELRSQGELLPALAQGPFPGQLRRDPAGKANQGLRKNQPWNRLKPIAEKLADALDIASVRQGRITVRNALGTFNQQTGSIRLKSIEDFDVLTHEAGHHLELKIGRPLQQLMKAFARELNPLAYPGAKKVLVEGFAEFVRLRITNPTYARNVAPGFMHQFDTLLGQRAPDILKAIDEVAIAWLDFLEQPSQQAVRSSVVSLRRPGWLAEARQDMARHGLGNTIGDRIGQAYAFAFDDLHPLNQAVRGLARIHKERTGKTLDIKASDDAYKLARMSRGAYQSGHTDLMFGVVPYRGTRPASVSLRDAIVEAMGGANVLSKWDDELLTRFGSYLWSRRAIGEWERFRNGLIPRQPDKLTLGDHVTNVTELEARFPQFATAAQKVYAWNLELWRKKRDAGLITQAQYDDGLQIVDYVPGQRDFSHDGDPVFGAAAEGKPGKSKKGGYVRRFQGSLRDVVNPLESLMADAYQTSMAIARNDVVKALDRLARRAGRGGARIAERIPSHEIRATMVDPLEVVENAGRQAGLSAPDIVALRDAVEAAVGDEKVAIFRPAIINEKGEAIAFFRDGGQLRALRLADGEFGKSMYRALTAMTPAEKNLLLELVAKPSTVLRTAITAAPEFLLANFVRDQSMASIFYGQPLRRLAGTVRGMGEELLGADTARLYNQAGGIMGGANVASLGPARLERDLQALRKKGWTAERSSMRGLIEITELSETGMRLGLFRTFLEEARGRGLMESEAVIEAAYRARDHIDFDRHGSGLTVAARLVPFLNASLQGLDKVTRQMLLPIARQMLGSNVTAEDDRAVAAAWKSWARLSTLMIAGVSLHAWMSKQPDYAELSQETRATHWMFKIGDKWLAVPKPFELATYLNLGEAAYDAMVLKDPTWGERYLDSLATVSLPPDLLEGSPLLKSAVELRTATDLRTGQEIVPEHLQGMEPWLQFTERTSELAKGIGKALDVSPAMVDQLILNHTASIGRSVLALHDWALSDKPLPGWDDAPITRRFIKDASRGSTSSKAFWGLISTRTGTLEGKSKSYRSLVEGGDQAKADDFLATLSESERAFVAVSALDADARRLHPLLRARSAVQVIGQIRREIAGNRLDLSTGAEAIDRSSRSAADDILASLAMTEARNALVLMGEPGWDSRKPIDTGGFYRELEAAAPRIFQALSERYAQAKVLPARAVSQAWPELRRRVLLDGTDAITLDLSAIAETEGYELDGLRLPERRKKIAVPGSAN